MQHKTNVIHREKIGLFLISKRCQMYHRYHCSSGECRPSEVSKGNHGLVQVSGFYFSFYYFHIVFCFWVLHGQGEKYFFSFTWSCMCKFCARLFPHLCLNSVNARDFQEQITIYLQISFIRMQVPKYPSISLNKICHYTHFSPKRTHQLSANIASPELSETSSI